MSFRIAQLKVKVIFRWFTTISRHRSKNQHFLHVCDGLFVLNLLFYLARCCENKQNWSANNHWANIYIYSNYDRFNGTFCIYERFWNRPTKSILNIDCIISLSGGTFQVYTKGQRFQTERLLIVIVWHHFEVLKWQENQTWTNSYLNHVLTFLSI